MIDTQSTFIQENSLLESSFQATQLNTQATPFQKKVIYEVKNAQDDRIRSFKGDVTKFLKNARGWFPSQIPKTIQNIIQRQCPDTGALKMAKNGLRLMCYNVLATSLTGNFEYATDPENLKWANRLPQIMKEISYINPDVLCLQETEENSGLHEFIYKQMKMEGEYFKKTAPDRDDGVAVFYNPDKYIMLKKFPIGFNFNPESDIYAKPYVALILVLQPIDHPDKILLVATSHLYFNINRGDTKLSQIKIITDATSQLKEYYTNILNKKVISIVCGDFNAGSRSGIYDFMRAGKYDCLKLNRNCISGQYHGTYSYRDRISSFALQKSCYNLDELPKLGEESRICEWYTELVNTYPFLLFDDNNQPTKFNLEHTLPFRQINMKFKRPQAEACRQYLATVKGQIDSFQETGMRILQILDSKDRDFFYLVNQCGPFKSAYAQNLLNHVHYINEVKQENMNFDYLDMYQKDPEHAILTELLSYSSNSPNHNLNYYDKAVEDVYGAYKWYKPNTNTREFLKRMSIVTKEPCYTSYTNIKLCVDFIFYQGENINVVRVLDLPAYSKYLKDNIDCLPHPLMPSDHFSIVADFLIQ